MAVVSGLAEEDMYDEILNVLTTTYSASPYMEKFVEEALCLMGEYRACLTRMLARYQTMIDDKDSTLWELWEKDAGTINHGWTGGSLTVLSKYFGGISPDTAGYESYSIKLTDVFASLSMGVVTPKGDLSYSIKKSEDGTVTITVAAIQAEGRLYIPAAWGTVSAGTAAVTQQGEYNVVALAAGSYTITVTP